MALRVGYEKLQRETGWTPKVSWEDGVARTIAWYAANRDKWIGRVDWLARRAERTAASRRGRGSPRATLSPRGQSPLRVAANAADGGLSRGLRDLPRRATGARHSSPRRRRSLRGYAVGLVLAHATTRPTTRGPCSTLVACVVLRPARRAAPALSTTRSIYLALGTASPTVRAAWRLAGVRAARAVSAALDSSADRAPERGVSACRSSSASSVLALVALV